jgi:hypothetical protein
LREFVRRSSANALCGNGRMAPGRFR